MTNKNIYQFEDFYLDSGTHSLFFNKEEIKLEPRVFDVLHLMLQRPNELISKDDFFEYVWEGKVVSDWALSRAIKVLRKTLMEKEPREMIKTLYGKGYLFVSEVKILEPEVLTKLFTNPSEKLESKSQKDKYEINDNLGELDNLADISQEKAKPNYLPFFIMVTVGLLVIYLFYWPTQNSDNTENTEKHKIKSIVVLPITNISGSEENEYLASGLTDVIIGKLAHDSSLRVISKTSAIYYKNKQLTSRAIANELNVETVLEGSIYPDKDKINLNLRLINAETEALIWSLNEQESTQEIYSLFRNTALKVVQRIAPNQALKKQQLHLQEKTNNEAFELYLRANYLLQSREARFLQDAETFLLLAIEKEPYFVEAYAKLANVYIVMSSYSIGNRIDWFKLAKEYNDDALILDDNSSIGWTNLGLIEFGYNYDLHEAKNAFKKAISINPNNVDAQRSLAEMYAMTSDYKKALEILEETWQKDTMNPLLISVWGSILMMDKQYHKALEKFELAKSFGSRFIWIDRDIAYTHQWRGDDQLSLKFRYLEMKNIGYFANGDQAFISATKKDGVLGFWQWRLPLLLNKWQAGKVHGCYIAEAYAGIKAYKKMLQWFNTGLEQKSEICFQLVKRSPEFYRFKDKPEFKSLLSKYDIAI